MKFTPQLKGEQFDLLMKALLTLTTTDEAHRFCEDVMTIKELESIAQRLEVAVMLNRRATYQEIAQKTGASTATISRVNRALHYGAEGYAFVLAQLDEEV